jgi:20S proteasome subunit alpha 6
VFKIDDHIGIAVSGLNSDGRSLCRYMRNETLNHRFVYETGMPVGRLVRQVADREQIATQRSWKRPYGVGLLVAGYDKTGARLFYNCPSGNYYEYKAMAIGSRSQAAKTYLERTFEQYESAALDALIQHSLKALSASIQDKDGELTSKNSSVAIVGVDTPFTVIEDAALQPHITALKEQEDAGGDGANGDELAGDGGAAPMES